MLLAQSLDLFEIAAKLGQLGAPALLGIAVYVLWTDNKAQRAACAAELKTEREAAAAKLQAAQDKLDAFQERERAENKALMADMLKGGSS